LPSEVGSYDTPGDAWGVAVSGNYAYVAAASSGLRIIDITNPSAPTETGFYDTPGNAYGVAVSGNFAFVADRTGGLLVIDVSNPAAPSLAGFYDTSGDAWSVAVSGTMALLADVSNLGIYDCSAALSASDHFALSPSSLSLSAYPNPFNATTQIRFDLPRASFVNLSVYDVTGRLVENLASRMYETGTHSVAFNGENQASGMYIVRMNSGGLSSSQKVMLLK
jgi:hypothetical protein